MYPLLVNALAATASNLIDRWAHSSAQKSSAASASFQKVLDALAASKPAAAPSALDRLRNEQLSSPEIRTALDSSDPTRPVSLQISPDGTISAQAPGQNPRPIFLSQETATLARTLGAMLPAPAVLPFSMPSI